MKAKKDKCEPINKRKATMKREKESYSKSNEEEKEKCKHINKRKATMKKRKESYSKSNEEEKRNVST